MLPQGSTAWAQTPPHRVNTSESKRLIRNVTEHLKSRHLRSRTIISAKLFYCGIVINFRRSAGTLSIDDTSNITWNLITGKAVKAKSLRFLMATLLIAVCMYQHLLRLMYFVAGVSTGDYRCTCQTTFGRKYSFCICHVHIYTVSKQSKIYNNSRFTLISQDFGVPVEQLIKIQETRKQCIIQQNKISQYRNVLLICALRRERLDIKHGSQNLSHHFLRQRVTNRFLKAESFSA